ncbi:site-specific integrase [Parashewanella curva]|uniref:Site-specific integrase n=1 Tax=Parashewanella curva TaxID=2338552 RepID=A0A3L8PZG5_9GAMM|nr:site-specific integrase [Parashewanella curva]RLV60169.1 site-specific integrase [Parashewanella curva]
MSNIDLLLQELDFDDKSLLIDALNELDENQNVNSINVINSLYDLTDQEISNCYITSTNKFSDEVWELFTKTDRVGLTFKLHSLPKGVHDYQNINKKLTFLFKLLGYFSIPHNDLHGTINSYHTTQAKHSHIRTMIKYLFIDNALYEPSKYCNNLILSQVLEAFNEAKKSEVKSHYSEFYKGLQFYISLSKLNLIPKRYQLPLSITNYNYNGIKNNLKEHELIHLKTYTPLSENELEKITKNIFTISGGIGRKFLILYEKLEKAKLLNKYKIKTNSKHYEWLNKIPPIKDINEKVIFEFNKDETGAIKIKEFTIELRDKVIGACICNICLLTGMRVSELQTLKYNSCIKLEDDNYLLEFTRKKTSVNPIKGDRERVPVVKSVFDSLEIIKKIFKLKLKEKKENEYLFAVTSNKNTNARKSHHGIKTRTSIMEIVRYYGESCNVKNLHVHRLRKTIAWLLISRSEKNIELVRHLLGHKSYKMTLKYILRNYELVDEVIHLFEYQYTSELTDLLQSIFNKTYSGKAGDTLSEIIKKKPEIFKANIVYTTVEEYIKTIIESGESIFLNRIPIGGYCIVTELSKEQQTPCMRILDNGEYSQPDPQLCDWINCEKRILTSTAIPTLKRDISFYKNNLKIKNLNPKVKKEFQRTITFLENEIINIEKEKNNPNNFVKTSKNSRRII